MDQLDRAEEEIEAELAEALRQRKPGGPPPTGFCHYCGEPLEPGWRWCGHGCEDEWEFVMKRQQQNARDWP